MHGEGVHLITLGLLICLLKNSREDFSTKPRRNYMDHNETLLRKDL